MGTLKTGAKALGGALREREKERVCFQESERDFIGDRGNFVCICVCVYILPNENPFIGRGGGGGGSFTQSKGMNEVDAARDRATPA